MKFFIDTEFIDRGRSIPLELISIGIAREDGATFYAINEDCLTQAVRHRWVNLNVVPWLPVKDDTNGAPTAIVSWDPEHPEYAAVSSMDDIATYTLKFLTEVPDGTKAELWADYGAYDHVLLSGLFGPMAEQPAGVPMYTNEFRTLLMMFEPVELPPQPEYHHHALADALWLKEAYEAVLQS